MKTNNWKLLCSITCVFLISVGSTFAQSKKPIQVMLLTGEEVCACHDWVSTTPALEKMLNDAGIFQVTVVKTPPKDGDFSSFMPAFSDYAAILLNYDVPAERWPEPLKKAFEKYMADGGGLITVHATDNSFSAWPEYNKMIGMGGWGGRNEAAGSYWYYKDSKLVSDKSVGRAGSHGSRVPFQMSVVNAQHPITKGLPSTWMHQGDELYSQLRGPGENMNVLITAYSDPANRGTGFNEPQAIALSYGKGRVFHFTPGHDVMGMASTDYVVLVQRGTEWAATGKVTQKVPSDFPSGNSVSFRTDIAKLDPNYKNGVGALAPRATAPGAAGGGRGMTTPNATPTADPNAPK